MRLNHFPVLALLGWLLMLPTTPPHSGDANAAPSPTVSIWNTFKTREACEQERRLYLDDPVIGPRMQAATCVSSTPAGGQEENPSN
jgi:hypothetical protein